MFTKDIFNPLSIEQLRRSRGGRTYVNPSKNYAKSGRYAPSLTLHKRVLKSGVVYHLVIEFSAPKMLFGNNFDEIEESDLPVLIGKLISVVHELCGCVFSHEDIANAKVIAWHPSKNIVFNDVASCLSVISTVSKLSISRIYDIQSTNFRDGNVFHIHTNSLDIALYDKLADLRKASISAKRSFERSPMPHDSLTDLLLTRQSFEVLRFEVRLSCSRMVKSAYPELSEWTLESLFKKELCKSVLCKHWEKITDSVQMIELDSNKPFYLAQNYMAENPDVKPSTALAAVAGLLIGGHESINSLRSLIEANYGRNTWYRLKPFIRQPEPKRYKHILHVAKTLEEFEKVSIKENLGLFKNSVN